MAHHNEVGKLGEEIAVKFLEKNGYVIFDRNYAFEKAEVDIVAYMPTEIIFVEVKTRSKIIYDQPEKSVDEAKMRSIFKAANSYLYERKLETVPVRFDIIAIGIENPDSPEIHHIIDAFR